MRISGVKGKFYTNDKEERRKKVAETTIVLFAQKRTHADTSFLPGNYHSRRCLSDPRISQNLRDLYFPEDRHYKLLGHYSVEATIM